MDVAILILQIVTLVALTIGSLLFKAFFPKYLEEKGKNLATKEDVAEITEKVESVKAEFSRTQSVYLARYQLKHEACLAALKLVDAHFSHSLLHPDITKQFATVEQARDCHNKLILACEDPQILHVFAEIVFGPQEASQSRTPPTDLLNRLRNLIRHELAFGNELPLDRERAWIGKVTFEPVVEATMENDGTDANRPSSSEINIHH